MSKSRSPQAVQVGAIGDFFANGAVPTGTGEILVTSRWGANHFRQLLDDTLEVRHKIAHEAIGSVTVGKGMAKEAAGLIDRLAGWTDAAVLDHLRTLPKRPTIKTVI